MKLCQNQKEVIVLIVPILICLILFGSGQLDPLWAVIAIIVGDGLLKSYFVLRGERIKKGELVLRKLNDGVLKKWKNTSIESENLHINIKLREEIDSDLLNQGKEFLKIRTDETRKILEIWTQLEHSKDKYNEIGDKIKKTIDEHLAEAYPSLKSLESRFLDSHRLADCYVRNNIISFIERSLKQAFQENGEIDWKKILHIERYEDTVKPTFRLVDYDVLIQSKNENDADIMCFGNVMEKLKPKILDHLQQLSILNQTLEGNLKEFNEKMNCLSNSIDLGQF